MQSLALAATGLAGSWEAQLWRTRGGGIVRTDQSLVVEVNPVTESENLEDLSSVDAHLQLHFSTDLLERSILTTPHGHQFTVRP